MERVSPHGHDHGQAHGSLGVTAEDFYLLSALVRDLGEGDEYKPLGQRNWLKSLERRVCDLETHHTGVPEGWDFNGGETHYGSTALQWYEEYCDLRAACWRLLEGGLKKELDELKDMVGR